MIDFLIILGGDGSLLHGVNFFKDRTAPPVLAFGKVILFIFSIYFLNLYIYFIFISKGNIEFYV